MHRIALAVLLALSASLARAEETSPMPVDAVVQQAITASALAGQLTSSPIDVKGRGDGLQIAVERAKVAPMKGYKWAVETDLHDSLKNEDPTKLINAAAKNIRPEGLFVPGPSVNDGLASLKKMKDGSRVMFDDLPETTLGIYEASTDDKVGVIKASRRVIDMCTLIGYKLCAAVLFHEVGHALDEAMHARIGKEQKEDMARVVREETAAFSMQQRYLRSIYASDQEGHEIFATTLMRLEAEQKIEPHPARLAAITFIRNCNEIYSAVDAQGHPDQAMLERLVRRLYKADGAPSAASA